MAVGNQWKPANLGGILDNPVDELVLQTPLLFVIEPYFARGYLVISRTCGLNRTNGLSLIILNERIRARGVRAKHRYKLLLTEKN
jgi:hypothetical protein